MRFMILEQNHIHEVDQKVRIRLGANKIMTWYCTSSDLASLGHLPQRGRLLRFKFQFMELVVELAYFGLQL